MAIGTHATVLPPTPRPKKLIVSGRFPQVALVGAGGSGPLTQRRPWSPWNWGYWHQQADERFADPPPTVDP